MAATESETAVTAPASPARNRRHLYGPSLVAGLLGAGGVAVAASKPWMRATASVPGLPTIHAAVSGSDIAPLTGALGVAMLAAFGAVVATRGAIRRLLGAVVFVAAVVVVVVSLHPGGATTALTDGLAAKGWTGGAYASTATAWRWLAAASAVLAALAGGLTAAYGGQWAEMGTRYDAPTPKSAPAAQAPEDLSETDVWRALDQGRDPTHDI